MSFLQAAESPEKSSVNWPLLLLWSSRSPAPAELLFCHHPPGHLKQCMVLSTPRHPLWAWCPLALMAPHTNSMHRQLCRPTVIVSVSGALVIRVCPDRRCSERLPRPFGSSSPSTRTTPANRLQKASASRPFPMLHHALRSSRSSTERPLQTSN